MDVARFYRTIKKIKPPLVFFCLAFFVACGREDALRIEQVDYENERAVGVVFSTTMDVENIRIFVGEESKVSVIGVIVSEKNKHSFTPVIPFTPGQTYTFREKDTLVLASFTIPERTKANAAELLAIYPKLDTVPENLLKMYFEFAQPMQEVGNALDFITVTNETEGRVVSPFLQLESELWNREHTELTLWLDPGRIKKGLIPNREKGLPLTAGNQYTVAIDSSWRTNLGIPLRKKYTKKFYVGPRDDKKPNVGEWDIRMQDEDNVKSLILDFGEPMDAFLAKETVKVYDINSRRINGQFKLLKNESVLRFIPDSDWPSSEIEIQVESRLEDLAGNNLNRLFDTQLGETSEQPDPSTIKSLRFLFED